MEDAYLVLNNGLCFKGRRIGSPVDSIGELVFTTGMVGYLETLTDPSYAGQIVLQTFPLIGNYGVIEEDFEGESFVRGYIVREMCDTPSNFRSEYALDRFLKERNIPGLCGLDTRAITRLLREEGVMNACICSQPPADFSALTDYRVTGVVPQVSCREPVTFPAEGERHYRVSLLDYGAKRGILRNLRKRGCEVTVFPWNTKAEDVLALGPDGLMLSNGPGDPAENEFCIRQLEKLIGHVPCFGICLGHQLAALAMGGETMKLKYGHRGANQPVRRLADGRCFITSQNHGYAVVSESMKGRADLSYVNANDQSCEGLDYADKRCFTVQFHPEASAGPHDTEFLFDRFLALMGGE